MPKVDYLNDPSAPTATSLVVAVTAIIIDDAGRLLMIQRADNGLWAIPGGGQEVGETSSQAAIREVKEETGVEAQVTGLVGIYSDPHHVIAYDDGEVRQEFSICYRGRPVGGQPTVSDESIRVEWIEASRLEGLDMHPSMRFRVAHGLIPDARPYLS